MNNVNTKNIGRKFTEEGCVRFFPGNTIISKLNSSLPIHRIAGDISLRIQKISAAPKYAFLPEESFHMTMIQGVCDEDRKAELWSRYLPLDCSLKETDDFFEQKFKEVGLLKETTMTFDFLDCSNQIIIMRFRPKTEQDLQNLKEYRETVSETLGLRFPDHDTYGFHISIAYLLWEMSTEETEELQEEVANINRELSVKRPEFCMPQPELTYFNHMFYFSSSRIERS